MAVVLKNKKPERFNIICSHPAPDNYPLGLGMILAYAIEKLPDRQYNLEPRFIKSGDDIEKHLDSNAVNVVLCSNHMWSLDFNLSFSRRAREIDPDCVTIHGGPSTPSYDQVSRRFIHQHPEIDYAVCGEGEATLVELLTALAASDPKKNLPKGVYTLVDGVYTRTPNRLPIEDLNSLPSPYLTGVFDSLDPDEASQAMLETNRGCPYQCVYCSWDDPMNKVGKSRLRMFEMDRVVAEIEWIASRGTPKVFVTDGNFGIRKRDVEIAELLASAARKHGSPELITLNYAKNNHENLIRIVEILDEEKLLSHGGIVSIQTRDPETLGVIKRNNVKPEVYDELRRLFSRMNLSLNIQLMLALPGATPRAFMEDLRYYFDDPVEVTMFRTMLLPNAPMANPDYLAEHEIEIDEFNLVSSTRTMSASDVRHMENLGCLFDACHNQGVLRLPLLWLQWDAGIDPIDVLYNMVTEKDINDRFPNLIDTLPRSETDLMHQPFRSKKKRPRYPWFNFHREFKNWINENYGETSPAFDAALEAQTALMPLEGRSYPFRVDLPHDVVSWYIDHKTGCGKKLEAYKPGTMKVKEPCYFWRKWFRKNIRRLMLEKQAVSADAAGF